MEIEQNLGWVLILDESNINQFWRISEQWIEKSPETQGTTAHNLPETEQLHWQKAVIPGFSRFLEHTSITWHQIHSV